MKFDPTTHILEYNLDIGKTKPDTVHRDASYCPFCDVAHLKNILDKRGPMIWLENAFPVLKDTWQTLIIETDDDNGEFSDYTPDYAANLVSFCLEKWRYVKEMNRFASVLFYRNYGPMSGGTIHHPHSQIVGLTNYDYHIDIKPYHLAGTPVLKEAGLEVNISTHPIVGFYEVNVILRDLEHLPRFVRYMQGVAQYFLHDFLWVNESYNIFYYDFPDDDALYVKIVPRFLTNPIFIGYRVSQVANEGHRQLIIDRLRNKLQSVL